MSEAVGTSYPVSIGRRLAGRVLCEGFRQWVALRTDGTRLGEFTSAAASRAALLRALQVRLTQELAREG